MVFIFVYTYNYYYNLMGGGLGHVVMVVVVRPVSL